MQKGWEIRKNKIGRTDEATKRRTRTGLQQLFASENMLWGETQILPLVDQVTRRLRERCAVGRGGGWGEGAGNESGIFGVGNKNLLSQ